MMNEIAGVRLITPLTAFFTDLAEVIRLFLGEIPVSPDAGTITIRHGHEIDGDQWADTFSLDGGACLRRVSPIVHGNLAEKRALKRTIKTGLYLLLAESFPVRPPWGSLTGIRPTRLMYEAEEAGMSRAAAEKWLMDTFFVTAPKAHLLSEILAMQEGVIHVPDDQFDLYIGIPFCTTRCAYCSFSSGEIGDGRRTQPYTDALIREIAGAGRMAAEKGLRVRAAYMGGGTPTAISCSQLESILAAAMTAFPGAIEWTVEAGRPDTIDREKLAMLKRMGVTRISVNPQTFSDETLRRIGRAHTGADTLSAFRLAREMGFDHINMDLIAALPGETEADFRHTLAAVLALAPESVTVHSLAIKRSSKLHEMIVTGDQRYNQADLTQADGMITLARETLEAAGYRPYYLYRQKYMAGNLENVGYAKPGCQCLYNIGNMEETARVLALGAGAISKWLFPAERRIERAANVKNIDEYIARTDEMLERKRTLIREG